MLSQSQCYATTRHDVMPSLIMSEVDPWRDGCTSQSGMLVTCGGSDRITRDGFLDIGTNWEQLDKITRNKQQHDITWHDNIIWHTITTWYNTITSDLTNHHNAIHEANSRQGTVDKLINCDQCPFISDNSNDVLLHQDTHHGSGEDTGPVYVCEICDMSYDCDGELSEHNSNMHINYSCDQCDFVSYGTMMMQYHMTTSHFHLSCDECEFVAKNKGGLTRHKNAKHENNKEPKEQDNIDLTTEAREEPSFLTINFPPLVF